MCMCRIVWSMYVYVCVRVARGGGCLCPCLFALLFANIFVSSLLEIFECALTFCKAIQSTKKHIAHNLCGKVLSLFLFKNN